MYRMLIVDDNPNDRRGISGLIDWAQQDIEVVGMAVNGEEGYQMAQVLKPDFVLTDVSMPIMNGIEMTEKIKLELPDTRFVFMSCFDDVEYLQSAINLEVSAYVLKPIDIDELVGAVVKMQKLKEEVNNRKKYESELLALVDQSLPLLQEQFLNELFYRKNLVRDEIQDRLEYLKMDMQCESFCIVLVHIDNYDMDYRELSMDQKHLLIFRLQKCVEETILPNRSGYLVSQNHDTVAIVRKFNTSQQSEVTDQIIECASKCIETANSCLELNISVGISNFSEDLKEISTLFQQAELASKSKFYSKGNRIIFYSEVCEPGMQTQCSLQDITGELRELMDRQEYEGIIGFVDRYYTLGNTYSEKYIKSLSYTIVNVLQTLLIEEGKNFGDVFDDELIIWRKLSLFETILDVRQFMINIIHTVCQSFNRDMEEVSNRIVEDIKNIIDTNYARIENVNQVIDGLYISASHANLVFKQHMGQTIFDYLTLKRVDAAKELLKDPYTKIYEVPEKIGYKTQAHFRSVFKEYTGMTPKQYQAKGSI